MQAFKPLKQALSHNFGMPDFTLSRFQITIKLLQSGILPHYKGSCLRGALGHALRDITCSSGRNSCGGCSEIARCLFTTLFKPDQIPGKSIPAPYLIDPPAMKETFVTAGTEFSFTLTLFGSAAEQSSVWFKAAQVAGSKFGLGEERILFEVVKVSGATQDGELLIPLNGSEEIPKITFEDVKKHCASTDPCTVKVCLLTPLKFKDRNEVSSTMSGKLFLDTLVRRLKTLSFFYQPGDPFKELSIDTSQVSLQKQQLRWVVLERKSMSNPTAINLGGYVGSFELTNITSDIFSLLLLGTYTHLGKNTVYGCGKYSVS